MKLKEKMATRSNSLQWGHNEFEIAKYHPSKYNGEGVYTDTKSVYPVIKRCLFRF